jgi:transcriptional regulator with XRE-family HTH domain
MTSLKKNVKIAVALRTARSAIGWNQQEFADEMAVAKSTIARIETLEVSPKADLLLQAMEVFGQAGVEVNFFQGDNLTVVVSPHALENAELRLMNEALRRTDRKGPLTQLNEALMVQMKETKKIKGGLAEVGEYLERKGKSKS